MRAVCWWGKGKIRVVDVPEPEILNPHDAIVRVTLTAICGSDLHLLDGVVPTMMRGDILGHEFMGEIVETGREVKNLKKGDRVIVPFPIACGRCWFCNNNLWSLCDNTNPNAWMVEALMGFAGSGIYGYSHMYGGYSGGQAEYVRVPFADVNPLKIPDGIPDEKVLFLTDILPTGYMAAENCGIQPGDVVAVWGAGPVGLSSIASARLLGAERIIVIDRIAERLQLAQDLWEAETLNYEEVDDVFEELKERTGGRGPDRCIDAVGMEGHGTSFDAVYDRVKQAMRVQLDRAHTLRQALHACRTGSCR
jgi:threonine dehydrogenase-like Zn-dependent dehydrogenase